MKSFIYEDIEKSIKDSIGVLDILKKKTILITGGTGFVGTWLTYTLCFLNEKYDFDCKIILLSRDQLEFKKNNKSALLKNNISFISSDIRSVSNLPKDINFIIHAASTPDNRMHMSDPVNTTDVISNGTKRILDESTRLPNIEGILHLSSGQVHNNSVVDKHDMNKGTLINNIKSIYSNAKLYSEIICLSYQSQYKLPITIARPFSFIGPFQELNKPWAINSFIQEAINNQTMRILGNGKPERSYLYGSDMAVWLLVLLSKGRRGSIYNIGSSSAISLLNITKKINHILHINNDVDIQHYNDDESIFIPNINSIKEELGVNETFDFEESLERTIEWNLTKRKSLEKN